MNKKLLRIILTVVLLVGAWLVEHFAALPMWQLLLVYLVPYLVIGYDVLGEAVGRNHEATHSTKISS